VNSFSQTDVSGHAMRVIQYVSTILLLFLYGNLYGQNKKVTGYLLISPWRTHNSFDLFFPSKIDAKKDLLTNLKSAKFDTAFQVSLDSNFYEPTILAKEDTLKNQAVVDTIADYLKYFIVMPVEGFYNFKAQELFTKNMPDEYERLSTILNGNKLFEVYNTKRQYFKRIKLIRLPKHGG
jgi:hypothetical protein